MKVVLTQKLDPLPVCSAGTWRRGAGGVDVTASDSSHSDWFNLAEGPWWCQDQFPPARLTTMSKEKKGKRRDGTWMEVTCDWGGLHTVCLYMYLVLIGIHATEAACRNAHTEPANHKCEDFWHRQRVSGGGKLVPCDWLHNRSHASCIRTVSVHQMCHMTKCRCVRDTEKAAPAWAPHGPSLKSTSSSAFWN